MNSSGRMLRPLAAAIFSIGLASRAQANPAAAPQAASASAAASTPVALRSPRDWIDYDDATFTPVADEVSRRLAAAGVAFDAKDNAKAAAALRAAADVLQGQVAEPTKKSTQ